MHKVGSHMLQSILHPPVIVVHRSFIPILMVRNLSFRLLANSKGLKWSRKAVFNAFQSAKGGWRKYHAKASSCREATNTSKVLAAGILLALQAISNLATCVSGSALGRPKKYGIWTTLVTRVLGLGGGGGLIGLINIVFAMENGCKVGGSGGGGGGKGIIVVIIVDVCDRGDKLYEVEPKRKCCGLIGDNSPSDERLSTIICSLLFGSTSYCSLCNFTTNQLFLHYVFCLWYSLAMARFSLALSLVVFLTKAICACDFSCAYSSVENAYEFTWSFILTYVILHTAFFHVGIISPSQYNPCL